MTRGRLEAFSDAVIAIVMTIMVLELRPPHGTDWQALRPLAPAFSTYLLSFAMLGIYWNNHHHLLHATERVDGRILWANMHLLFWLSLIPFVTGWMGDTKFAAMPTSAYGVVMLGAAIAYYILQGAILARHGPHSKLAEAVGNDFKGKVSLAAYALAIPLAFVFPWISIAMFVLVALMWLVPDPRIESTMNR